MTKIFGEKPCDDALEFLATQPDLATAWDNCKRGDWLWWVLCRVATPEKQLSVAFARECTERAKQYADAATYAYADGGAYAAAYAAERARQADWIHANIVNPFRK